MVSERADAFECHPKGDSVVQIVRLLPSQYDELLNVQDGYRPEPSQSIVVVVKDNQKIVGRTMLIRPWHIEGTWIDEAFRNGTAGPRMIQKLEEQARIEGISKLFSYSNTPEISNYLQRLGFSVLPVSILEKNI